MARRNFKVVDVTLVVDTAIYASGDVLAITAPVSGALRDNDTPMILQTVTMIDEGDQGVAMDVYFLDANVSFGALNAAAAPTDTAVRSVMAKLPVAAADWKDLGGARVATYNNLNMPLKPAAGGRDIYVVVVNGTGTPTFTAASDLKMRLGLSD
jgi:hypothetical protein